MANKGGKRTDIGKQGLSSIKNAVVKNNLMGISPSMEKKDWTDSQGRKGKVNFMLFSFMTGVNISLYSYAFLDLAEKIALAVYNIPLRMAYGACSDLQYLRLCSESEGDTFVRS